MWPILLLLLLVYVRGEVKNIAVIGSGISGSFVTNTLGNAANAEITIFGPSGCGRVKSDHIQFGGKTVVVEMGASIAYGGNKYIAERAPNLSKKKPYEDNPESTFGIYSVSLSSFKFKQSNIFPPSFPPFLNKVYNKLYLLFTYPQLLFLIPHVNRAASALDSLYVSLSSGTTFSTPSSVWSSLSLSALLTTPWSTFFENEISPFPSRLHSELSAAVNRVNYNAEIDDDLPALVSLVSHVPLVSGDLFNYAEGNDKICQSVRHGTHVDGIVSLVVYDGSIGKFFLYVGSSIGGDQEGYDTVVLSTPWQQREGGLEFKETSHVDGAVLMDLRFDSYGDETEGRYHGFDNEEVNRKEYKSTVTTYVDAKGRIEGGRLGDDGYVPESVFFTDGSWGEDGVFSITLIMEEDGRCLYKVFSLKELGAGTMDGLFGEGTKKAAEQVWAPHSNNGAYPTFSSSIPSIPFKLDSRGIWSTGVFESTGSAMEIMAIAGTIVGNGIIEEMGGRRVDGSGPRTTSNKIIEDEL